MFYNGKPLTLQHERCRNAVRGRQVTTEPFKTKSTDLQPVVLVGDSLTMAVDVTDLNPANHVLRVRIRSCGWGKISGRGHHASDSCNGQLHTAVGGLHAQLCIQMPVILS